MEIIVLSQNGCRPCGFVKNFLDNQEVNYTAINVSEQKEYIDKFNIMSTPVTILLDDQGNEVQRVNGFNPPEIEKLIEQI